MADSVVPGRPAIPPLSAAATLAIAAAVGLATGLVDAAWLATTTRWFHRYYTISPEAVWMAPVANLAIFTAVGIGLLALRAGRISVPPVVTLAVFGFLAFAGILALAGGLDRVARLLLSIGLGIQAARLLVHRLGSVERLARRAVPWMAAATLGIAVVTFARGRIREHRALASLPGAPAGQKPNILLLILDTVRAANLGVYGYARPTTPRLQELVQSSIVFDFALSPSSWTMPSHASMFTGRSPHELTADWQTPLDTTFPTIAEAMAAGGYATAGFVANAYYAGRNAGLDRGFVHFEDYRWSVGEALNSSSLGNSLLGGRVDGQNRLRRLLGSTNVFGRRTGDQIRRAFVDWLAMRPRDRPFFAFLNFFDAHIPYAPPPPFRQRFARSGPDGRPDPMGAYDGAIAYLDHEVGLIRQDLAAAGLDRNTVIVVTADHGELFGEHGLTGHGNALYLDQLRVPLLVSLPGGHGAGTRIAAPVTLADFPATVLELAGIARAPATLGTRSWSRWWAGNDPDTAVVISEIRAGIRAPRHEPVSRGDMISLVGLGLHYIKNGDGIEELYDVAADPQEATNLAGNERYQAAIGRLRSLAPKEGWKPRR